MNEPKKPIEGNWEFLGPDVRNQGFAYKNVLGFTVISSVHVVENNDGMGKSPHFHISISDKGTRIAQYAALRVLKQFGAEDFEEDNHSPMKIIRSFWKKCEGPDKECPCKDEEKPEIDGDYTWREAK